MATEGFGSVNWWGFSPPVDLLSVASSVDGPAKDGITIWLYSYDAHVTCV